MLGHKGRYTSGERNMGHTQGSQDLDWGGIVEDCARGAGRTLARPYSPRMPTNMGCRRMPGQNSRV